jgi:hypothetical protein
MFQHFTVIMNNMRANVAVLPGDDHDRVVKLLHSLDRTVWSWKVEAILESEKFESSSCPRWTVGVTSLMFIVLMTLPSSINQVYLAHNHV